MKLRDKYGGRLNTKNFRKVTSEAVLSIDYDQRLKTIEIEYHNKEVYNYLNTNNKEWAKMIEFANKGKGLGAYLNHDFKKKHDYYKLIVLNEGGNNSS
jgi:hypothetical protein